MSIRDYRTLLVAARDAVRGKVRGAADVERIARDSVSCYYVHYVAQGAKVDNPSALVRKIAKNAVCGESKKDSRRRSAENGYAETFVSGRASSDPAGSLYKRELSERFRRLVDEFASQPRTHALTATIIRLWLAGHSTTKIKQDLGLADARKVRGAISSFVRFLKTDRGLNDLAESL